MRRRLGCFGRCRRLLKRIEGRAVHPGGKTERGYIKVCACAGHSRAQVPPIRPIGLMQPDAGQKTNPLMRNQGSYTRTRICFLKTSLTI